MKKWVLVIACILLVLIPASLASDCQNFASKNRMLDFRPIPNRNVGESWGTCSVEEKDQYENLSDMPLEMIISRRISIHYGSYYNLTAPVPPELVSKVLWTAYGYSWRGRTIPSLFDYPIIIYVCNKTAAYKYLPENQSLSLWKNGDYRSVGGGYLAPIMLYIAVNTSILNNVNWGSAEAGSVIQSIYLMANALNLGTVCEGGTWMNRTHIKQDLGLPENQEVLYQMPLGYPLPPYKDYQNLIPTSRPSSPELPEIKDSNLSLKDALDSVFSSHGWSENPVTRQELSQVLWASYGYSYYLDNASNPPKKHRTVPSAGAYYPMRIYAANSSGVYKYIPEQHTLKTIVAEDRRQNIASASGNTWASSAPLIIAVMWDDSHILTVDRTYVEVGLIAQNVYLESAAWGLVADWGKADANEDSMRDALGLTGEAHLHPASVMTIGHPSKYLNRVEWDKETYYVETKTNSTVMNFNFDQLGRKLSFNVSAPSGTVGFCNVTLPNTLLWGDFTVLVDGNLPASLTQKDNATHISLYFTYHLVSTRKVQIIAEHVIPEFLTWVSRLLVFLAITATIIICKRKLSKENNLLIRRDACAKTK